MTNAERAEAVIAEMCALHPYASRPAWRAIVERALSSQEAEIERLRKIVRQYCNRTRMAWAPPELQPSIDAALTPLPEGGNG